MKKYGNDYRQSGKQFEYTGKWYGTGLSQEELKKHGILNTVLMTVALLVYFSSLMVNNAGSRIFWILLPYMVIVFPAAYGIMGGVFLVSFCRRQEGREASSQVIVPQEHTGHMTRAEYEKGIRRPARCSMAVVILALIASVADLVFLVRGSGNFIINREMLFLAAAVMILILGSVTAVQNWHVKAKFTIFS